MIYQILGAFIAISAASIVLETPKRFVFRTGIVGAVGWATYLIFAESFGPIVSTFFSGIIISLISHIFSRIFKIPSTIFFIPGFYPLVPGYRIYMGVYNFIAGNNELAQQYFIDTIKISGMIALAIFAVDTIFNQITRIINDKRVTELKK